MSKPNQHKWTKTTSFLLPACGLDAGILFEHGFINAYLDDEEYNKSSTSEEDIFILFEPDEFDDEFELLCDVLRGHTNFLEEYDPTEGQVMFRFKLSKKWSHIKKELMSSKYSKIDREYIEEFFNPKIIVGEDIYGNLLFKDSVNYQILTKSPILREQWEEKLGVTFKDEYEVCSKLNMKEEVYRKKQEREDYGQQII